MILSKYQITEMKEALCLPTSAPDQALRRRISIGGEGGEEAAAEGTEEADRTKEEEADRTEAEEADRTEEETAAARIVINIVNSVV